MAFYFDGVICTATRLAAESLLESLGRSFELHSMGDRIRKESSVFYLSVIPRGMGLGVPYDSDDDVKRNSHQRKQFAKEFYDKIAGEKDVLVALLGWEIEDAWFDPTETNKIDIGITQLPNCLTSVPGLVVSDTILAKFPNTDRFFSFSSRHHWIPIKNWDKIDRPHG